MQMYRMLHHSVVYEDDSRPFSQLEPDRLSVGEFLAIEPPDEAFHVAGQMQFDLAVGRARIGPAVTGAQVGVGQYAATGVIESVPWLGEPLHRHHRDVIDLRTFTQCNWLGRRWLSCNRRR